jgi:hypothetical protein
MNRKNRGLTLAALLGIFLFALTCGAALAGSPVFYVKMDNRTDAPVKIKWHFSQRDGEKSAQDQITTIPPHKTTRFVGPAGYGRMHYQFHTGGEGSNIEKKWIDADADPQALKAICFIKYNEQGVLSVVKHTPTDNF